ncbi:uncharacterized protein LOC127376931 [Dicentrarchus labrax]|uniref:uncharacterized protein LOC127376931 n=1 Tax=Dicentrarchus labrax TaxID=13489 RepID=UPI0021F5AE3C|nr:uncharacterized protein LOC127376931 [Dicentrarchus labrax]XP_051280346.1 uncharacterized protein LOC127376931 [Dicentrarchus labrax]
MKMNIHHFLFFCFSSALFDGGAGLDQSQLFKKMKGEDFRNSFAFQAPTGSRMYLCRNDCKKEDVVVETSGNRAVSGRYTIRYDRAENKVVVVILGLTQSDAGLYTVGVSGSSLGPYRFEIKVKEICDRAILGEPRVHSATEGGNITITCHLFSQQLNRKFFCTEECNTFLIDTNNVEAMSDKYIIIYGSNMFKVTITQLTKSDSGRYQCGVGRLGVNECQKFEITVTGGVRLRPVVYSIVVIVLLVVCLLLVHKWKTTNVDYVNTRGTERNMEISIYDDCCAVSTHEEPVYQELDPCSSDHNVYSSLEE